MSMCTDSGDESGSGPEPSDLEQRFRTQEILQDSARFCKILRLDKR